MVLLPNYPILAFHCPNIHFSIARSKTNILSYRIYESLEKIKKKKKRRNLDTGKRGSKDGDTKRSKGLIFRIVLCRLHSQFRGKLLVLRGRFQLSRRSGATKLQPLNARNSRKSQSSGHRSTVHCWPNTRAGARCEHENTGISISYKTINGGLNRNKNCKSPIAYDVYAVMELPDF